MGRPCEKGALFNFLKFDKDALTNEALSTFSFKQGWFVRNNFEAGGEGLTPLLFHQIYVGGAVTSQIHSSTSSSARQTRLFFPVEC